MEPGRGETDLVLSGMAVEVLMIGVVGTFFPVPVAVLGHEIGEFIVIGSSLRMLRA